MAWVILAVAGIFEICWAISLKSSEGFTRLWPTVITAIAMVLSVGLLGLAVRSIPIGTAYAIWTGIGTAGAVILGVVLLGEPLSPMRVVCLVLIALGIVGLKFTTV